MGFGGDGEWGGGIGKVRGERGDGRDGEEGDVKYVSFEVVG